MLARATPNAHISLRTSLSLEGSLLPFLYCTHTILRSYATYNPPQARHAVEESIRKPARANPRSEIGGDKRGERKNGNFETDLVTAKNDNKRNLGGQRKDDFGDDGFKVNEPWETVWKRSPPPQASSKPPRENPGDQQYDPFAGWSGPSSEAVKIRPRKKAQRDTSHVPFERTSSDPRKDPHADLEGTTITPNEKRAFQSLFELHKSRSAVTASTPDEHAPQTSSDHDRPLNNVIRKVESGAEESPRLHRPQPEFPEPLRRLKETIVAGGKSTSSHLAEKATEAQDPVTEPDPNIRRKSYGDLLHEKVNSNAQRHVFEVRRLMQEAKTDVEVWNILETHVLNSVIALGLDGETSSKSKKKRSANKVAMDDPKKDVLPPGELQEGGSMVEGGPKQERDFQPETQLKIMDSSPAFGVMDGSMPTHPQPALRSLQNRTLQTLSRSFPRHLINAFMILVHDFPGSPLPFNLIPHVKSLGPSTATLGLSTELYNRLINHHWRKYRDPLSVCEILREMNTNVYEFNQQTHDLVMTIMDQIKRARSGELGHAALMMSRMDSAVQGHRELEEFVRIMKQQKEQKALARAREKEAEEEEERLSMERFGSVDDEEESMVILEEDMAEQREHSLRLDNLRTI